jgi:hypothetical protein
MQIPVNVRIRKVERGAAIDRYGERRRNLVREGFGACIERSQFMTRNVDGSDRQADGSLIVPLDVELKSDDRITLDVEPEEVYTVFRAQESLDFVGAPQFRTYVLVKAES